jgi:hypothetical protein
MLEFGFQQEASNIMHQQRLGARAEHRQRQRQRVKDSLSLADRFARLKSLTVELSFYDPDGLARSSQLKYKVNLINAKSVFRFNCPNNECVRGDFDLTENLVEAVASRQKVVTGEIACRGWRSKEMINSVRCANLLRYKFTLGY